MGLHRFELAFNGVPQGIDILYGLDDIDLPREIAVNIEAEFNDLACPRFPEKVSFWFTERGACEFKHTIEFLAEQSRKLNWTILWAEIPEDNISRAIYADKFQVAFPVRLIEMLNPQYEELFAVVQLPRG